MFLNELKGISLMKLERVVWLRFVIYANDLEAGTMVAHRRTPGSTEEIQQQWLATHLILSVYQASFWPRLWCAVGMVATAPRVISRCCR